MFDQGERETGGSPGRADPMAPGPRAPSPGRAVDRAGAEASAWPDAAEPRGGQARPLPDPATFAGRYGDVLACGRFNVWPDALLLEDDAPNERDRLPHWRRIGLDRYELLFLLVALRYYHARGQWPAVPVERMARWLGLAERRVQGLKNGLIEDGYLVRRERRDPTGKRLPDALDLSPLFALLEACLYKYQPHLVTVDAQPAWQPAGPTARWLDPDEFGRARLERVRARQRSARGPDDPAPALSTRSTPHPAIECVPGVQPVAPSPGSRVHPWDAAGCGASDATGCAGSEPLLQTGSPERPVSPRPSEHPATGETSAAAPVAAEPGRAEPKPPAGAPDPELAAVLQGYARAFRDDDFGRSLARAQRLWWNSKLRREQLLALVVEAGAITRAAISAGRVRTGAPGQRAAMGYFFGVLENLIERARGAEQRRAAVREQLRARSDADAAALAQIEAVLQERSAG